MKKMLACAAVAIAAASAVFGFQGRLVGSDGQPLVGARVQVLGERGSAITDMEGRFRLEPSTPPPFELLVTRADGVAMRPHRVESLPADGEIVITIGAAREETVTVLGQAADLELSPAAAMTLLGRGDLEQRNPQQLTDVLDGVAGANRNGDGLAGVPALRGMAQGRTLILLDESRVIAERRAGPSATFLDPSSIDEVEIVRGPGSVAYGSDAFGGVIRTRTRLTAPGEPLSLRYNLAAGSGDDMKSVGVEAGTSLAGGGLMVGGSYRKLDEYDSPQGTVPDSGGTLWGVRAGYQRQVGRGLLRALWRSDMGRDIGKPSIDSSLTRTTYPEDTSHRLSVGYEQPGPGSWSRLAVSVSWDEYQILTRKDVLPTSAKPRKVTDADVLSHDYGVRMEAERAIGAARLILGIDASGRFGLQATNETIDYTTGGEVSKRTREVSIDSARRDDFGLFAALSARAGIVEWSGGARYDRVESQNSEGYFGDQSRTAGDFSGFMAATVALAPQWSLTGQVARGFREPLLSDRYYRGISGRGFITGNPDLDPETSRQADGALRWSGDGVQVAVYGFWYRIEDLIERYKTGSDYFFQNRGAADVKGFEIEATIELPSSLSLQAAVQRHRGEVRDDGSAVDGIPADGIVLTVRRDSGQPWWWLARVGAYARDERKGPTERVVPGYAVVDAGFGYRVSEAAQVQLLLRNLLDHSYFGSSDEKTILAPGRSVQLMLRGRI